MRVVRATVLVAALVACAWFVVGIRQVNGAQRASSIIERTGHLTSAQAAAARSALDEAGTLNPNAALDILRARVALEQFQPARARQLLLAVTAREPANIDAWSWLARSSLGHTQTLALAIAEIKKLAPAVPSH